MLDRILNSPVGSARSPNAAQRWARARRARVSDAGGDAAPGGQALHEFQRRHLDVRGAVAINRLQLEPHPPRVVHARLLIGDGSARDIAAQVLKLAALLGDADPIWVTKNPLFSRQEIFDAGKQRAAGK